MEILILDGNEVIVQNKEDCSLCQICMDVCPNDVIKLKIESKDKKMNIRGNIMVKYNFEYIGRQLMGKINPLVDSEYFYISLNPSLENSILKELVELTKLEITNLEPPFNGYVRFCEYKNYENKTYFAFKIDFPTLAFMTEEEKRR